MLMLILISVLYGLDQTQPNPTQTMNWNCTPRWVTLEQMCWKMWNCGFDDITRLKLALQDTGYSVLVCWSKNEHWTNKGKLKIKITIICDVFVFTFELNWTNKGINCDFFVFIFASLPIDQKATLGVSWAIYVNVDSPYPGFPNFNF